MAIWRIPVALNYSDNGAPGVNVWHVRTTTDGSPTDGAAERAALNAAVDSIQTFYVDLATGGDNPLAAGTSGGSDEAFVVGTDQVYVFDNPIEVVSPTGVGDAPPALAIVVGWLTDSRSRRGRGRTFLGPLNSACIASDGTPNAPTLTNIRGAAQGIVDRNGPADGWAVGVYGLQNSGGNRQSPHVLRDITAFAVRNQFAVLRSRRD